jgi:hypothetical protein
VIKAPAIAIMASAGVGLVVTILSLLFQLIAYTQVAGEFGGPALVPFVAEGIYTLIGLIANGLAFLGGYKMFRIESWGLALTASILMLFSCWIACLGFPIGIWAIVILCLGDVREAFD